MFHGLVVLLLALSTTLLSGLEVEAKQSPADFFHHSRASAANIICADPSLTKVVYQGFGATPIAHILSFIWGFVHADTVIGTDFWTIQDQAFRAWPSQQPSTAPLWRLTTANQTDYVFLVGSSVNISAAPLVPPAEGGQFVQDPEIAAWVYEAPVCGSMPLMSISFPPRSDHYWTTDAYARDVLIANGWVNGSVVAYVLPL